MQSKDREVRFMAARDLTQHLLQSIETDSRLFNNFIVRLSAQVIDHSREVRLNAVECLELLYASEKIANEGMLFCLLHL